MSFLQANNFNNKMPTLIDALPIGDNALLKNITLVISGILILWMTSQIRINLFFTPVPVTGQTFGVLLLASSYGSKLGILTIFSYLLVGIVGLPVFSGGGSGWEYFSGATAGYLIGFAIAAYFVGFLAEKGWDRKPLLVISSMILGNAVIYFFGVLWLSFSLSIGISKAISLGLTPFIIGDIFKILIAATLLPGMWQLSSYFKFDKSN